MGAHWTILQSVAWTRMMISYSQQSSFKEALEKTFDGKHPCPICKVVKAGRCSEPDQERQKLPLKLELFIYRVPVQGVYPPSLEPLRQLVFGVSSLPAEVPPTPPPISSHLFGDCV